MPTIAPGVSYPTIRGLIPDRVDDAIRNAYDNIFYLRGLVLDLQAQVTQLKSRLAQSEARTARL